MDIGRAVSRSWSGVIHPRCYPPAAQGDVLQAGHLLALTLLDHLDERRGLGQRVMSAGVQPGEAPAQGLQTELAALEELLVHGGYLQLAAG